MKIAVTLIYLAAIDPSFFSTVGLNRSNAS